MDATAHLSQISNSFPEQHSEELHDIISRPPHWLISWGTILFFVLAMLLCFGTWWIRYPDIISASFSLTAVNAPRAIIVRSDGKLSKLLVKDGQKVEQGQNLAFSESAGDHQQIIELADALNSMSQKLARGQWESLQQFTARPYTRLGELQNNFQSFNQELNEVRSFLSGGFYQAKRNLLVKDQRDLIVLENVIADQLSLQQKDFQLAQDEFSIQKKLHDSKVISSLEFNRERSKLFSREMPIKTLNSSLLQNQSAQTSKQKELLELDNIVFERKNNFLQAIQSLTTSLEVWKQKYILTAPVGGIVSFSAPLLEQQHIATGTELMMIEPETGTFQGIVRISQSNIGKLSVGQHVLIKLDGFPYREYGIVEGTLSQLSVITARDSTYWGYVNLPHKLRTRYNLDLPYRNGLKGKAEIITAERRLAERLLGTIKNGRQ